MIDTPFELLKSTSIQSPLTPGRAGHGLTEDFSLILADGEQPAHDVPLRLLQQAPYVVCCDGAIQRCDRADAVVGDGDSIPSWAREAYGFMFHQVDEQYDNDLTKATRFCISKGFRRLVYLGATGRREDHTLGNISLMMRYAREFGVEPLMVTNYGWFVPVCPKVSDGQKAGEPYKTTFASMRGQQVSLFNFGCTELRTEGLRYDGYAFSSWWQGTLNEAAGSHFSIVADGDYMVYRTFEASL